MSAARNSCITQIHLAARTLSSSNAFVQIFINFPSSGGESWEGEAMSWRQSSVFSGLSTLAFWQLCCWWCWECHDSGLNEWQVKWVWGCRTAPPTRSDVRKDCQCHEHSLCVSQLISIMLFVFLTVKSDRNNITPTAIGEVILPETSQSSC